MSNIHKGSTFDSFLEQENLLEEVKATAIKRIMALSLMVPNAATARAIKEAKSGKGLKKFKNAEDLFADLGI